MSAATQCDECEATTTERDELELHWFKVEQGGDRKDFCTASCAAVGIEKMQAANDAAFMEAMDDDDD